MNTKVPLKLYYNVDTDELGIAGESWDYLCLCRFVPFVRLSSTRIFADGNDPIAFVAHEIAEPMSEAWQEIGTF